MIVHIAELSALPELVTAIPENAKILAEAFWPGPLTMVLPRSSKIPLTTTGGLETVAIRMPSHPVARAVIRAAGVPLAAPSANRSGSPSPTTFRHCVDDLWGQMCIRDSISGGTLLAAGPLPEEPQLYTSLPRDVYKRQERQP